MAAFTTYTDGTTIAPPLGAGQYAGTPGFTCIETVYDASRRNAAVGDVVTVANIPAGMVVFNVAFQIDTTDAGGGTLTIGDASSANGWLAAQALNAAVKGIGAGTYVVAGGKLFTADTPVTMTAATAAVTTAKIRIQIFGFIAG